MTSKGHDTTEITLAIPLSMSEIDKACRSQCCFPGSDLIRSGIAAALQHTPVRRLTINKVVAEVRRLADEHDAKFDP